MIRLDFPGYSGENSPEHIGWDEWFEKFDEHNLALLYQENTAGGERSNFSKLVSRETAEGAEEYGHSKRVGAPAKKKKGESEPRHPDERQRFANEPRHTKRPMGQSPKASRIRMPDGNPIPVVEYRNAEKFKEGDQGTSQVF